MAPVGSLLRRSIVGSLWPWKERKVLPMENGQPCIYYLLSQIHMQRGVSPEPWTIHKRNIEFLVSGLKPRWGTTAQEANAVPIPTVEPSGEQYPQNLSIWGPMWCGRQSDGSTITSPFLPWDWDFVSAWVASLSAHGAAYLLWEYINTDCITTYRSDCIKQVGLIQLPQTYFKSGKKIMWIRL